MGITMAEAARQLGVSVTLIRRYEREFNLDFRRTEQGRCELSEQDVSNLATICEAREQGASADTIRATLSRNFMVPTETLHEGPDVREVIAALVARQDELEKVVSAQGATLARLKDENLRLHEAHDHMQLLLAAPADTEASEALDERLGELEARAAATEKALVESAKDDLIRKLGRRLLDLEAAVATELSAGTENEEGLLEELARTITHQAKAVRRRPWWQLWK